MACCMQHRIMKDVVSPLIDSMDWGGCAGIYIRDSQPGEQGGTLGRGARAGGRHALRIWIRGWLGRRRPHC